MIVRPHISLHSHMHFLLIVKELHQDVAFLVLEENNLDIRRHRRSLEVAPMLVHLGRSSYRHIKVFYLQQRQQRNHVAVMTETQSGGNRAILDSRVCRLDDILDQNRS